MKNEKKYSIENFYVGELYLSYQFGNLLLPIKLSEEEVKERRKKYEVVKNGGIDFQRRLMKGCIDRENRRHYEGVLTIFYKDHNDYICLHNTEKYTSTGFDYCDNLVPLRDLMPKIGCNIPTDLSIRDSLCLFEHLFHRKKFNKVERMQDKTFYNINDFYMGNLNLYRGFNPNEDSEKYNYSYNSLKYHYHNLPQKYVLYNSAAQSSCWFSFRAKECDKFGESIGSYDYTTFRCLFLKLPDKSLYNINDFQIYNNGYLGKGTFSEIEVGKSYYDEMISFPEVMEDNNIKYENDTITIQKVLKLSKNIK